MIVLFLDGDINFFDPALCVRAVETELVVVILSRYSRWIIEESAFFEMGDNSVFLLLCFEKAEGGGEMFRYLLVLCFPSF